MGELPAARTRFGRGPTHLSIRQGCVRYSIGAFGGPHRLIGEPDGPHRFRRLYSFIYDERPSRNTKRSWVLQQIREALSRLGLSHLPRGAFQAKARSFPRRNESAGPVHKPPHVCGDHRGATGTPVVTPFPPVNGVRGDTTVGSPRCPERRHRARRRRHERGRRARSKPPSSSPE